MTDLEAVQNEGFCQILVLSNCINKIHKGQFLMEECYRSWYVYLAYVCASFDNGTCTDIVSFLQLILPEVGYERSRITAGK